MKHLKMSMYLLLTAVIFIGCEKETTVLESIESKEQKNIDPTGLSLSFDAISYKENLSKQSKKSTISARIEGEVSGLTFFSDDESFGSNNCDNLVLEDFETSKRSAPFQYSMINSLNSLTENDIYNLGDISENVTIYASQGGEYGDLSIQTSAESTAIRTLYTGDDYTINYLNIGFTNDDVYSVSMDLLSLNGVILPMQIEIYDVEGMIGSVTVSDINEVATFFGVTSETPIKRITLNLLGWAWEGIDNLRFGTCIPDTDEDGILNENDLCANTPSGEAVNENGCGQSQLDYDGDGFMNTVDSCSNTPSGESVNENGCGQSQLDYDGDGVMNNKDLHIYSDLHEYLNIVHNSTTIKNKMVKNGSTMMDQLNDLIRKTNKQYKKGQNYAYHHKRFMTELAQLTYNWRMARLITATQRSQISSIAWGATIPYYKNEN